MYGLQKTFLEKANVYGMAIPSFMVLYVESLPHLSFERNTHYGRPPYTFTQVKKHRACNLVYRNRPTNFFHTFIRT